MLHMAAQQTQEIMDPLSAAIVKQFPEKFEANAPAMSAPDMTAPMATGAMSLAGPTTANDGKSLSNESAGTQAMFGAVWAAGRADRVGPRAQPDARTLDFLDS